jgi:CheY-like chemotaxis protein
MARESIPIVDDSLLNQKLARVLLESDGYRIRTAGDGKEALSTLLTYKPDLVLMDIQLPGIDGLEVTDCERHLHAGTRWLYTLPRGAERYSPRLNSDHAEDGRGH